MLNQQFAIREQLIKPVVKSGNGGAVWVPKDWLGQEVIVILPERPQVNIRQNILRKLEPRLKDVIGVYLYGSYARQEQTPQSDIDVLVVTREKTFEMKESGLEFTILPLERLRRAIQKSPEMFYTMVQEAQPIINEPLLEELQNIQPEKKALRAYLTQTKEHLKTSRQLFELDKQEGSHLKSHAVMYSVMLRLRGIFIIQCIVHKKRFSSLTFRKWLEAKSIKKSEFQEAYQAFRAVRDEKKIKQKLSLEMVERLMRILEEETDKLREKL